MTADAVPPVPLVPREVLFGNPDKVQPRISPDGRRLAYIAPRDGVLNVWVGEIGASEDEFRVVTDDTDRGSGPSSGPRTTRTCSTSRTPAATRTGGSSTSNWPAGRSG